MKYRVIVRGRRHGHGAIQIGHVIRSRFNRELLIRGSWVRVPSRSPYFPRVSRGQLLGRLETRAMLGRSRKELGSFWISLSPVGAVKVALRLGHSGLAALIVTINANGSCKRSLVSALSSPHRRSDQVQEWRQGGTNPAVRRRRFRCRNAARLVVKSRMMPPQQHRPFF